MKRLMICVIALVTALSLTSCGLIFAQPGDTPDDTIGGGSKIDTGGVGTLTVETTGGHGSIGTDDFTGEILYGDVLQTGKSDCIVFRFAGQTLMVDTAELNDYEDISAFLKQNGIDKIDHLIITHFDNDHVGSAGPIIRNFNVGKVYLPAYTRVSDYYSSMMAALNRTGCETEVCRVTSDLTFAIGDVSVTVNPTHLYDSESEVVIDRDDESIDAEENNFSLITRIAYGQKAILLTGDAEDERLAEYLGLCSDSDTLSCRCDVMKLPHHGGYEANLAKLISRSGMTHGIICAGSARDVDDRLDVALKTCITYTTYSGHVSFRTDGAILKFDK